MPPGTRLLLQGGRRFPGQLTLSSQDAGSAGHPVLIGTYGSGRATIVADHGSGIVIYDTAGIVVHDLNVVGGGSASQSGSGINIFNSRPGYLSSIDITGVGASGFGYGIAIGSHTKGSGFRDVAVSDAALHNNVDGGLVTYGAPYSSTSPSYAVTGLRITRVTAYSNAGDPANKAFSTGSGIILGSVSDGSVAWSAAYNNGGRGGSYQGPEGIWAYNSTGVTIEHDISYGNKTADHVDGNGFGLDVNTFRSCLQYDLSFNNDGAGYMLYGGSGPNSQALNVVRFNISSSDSRDRKAHFGGITVSGNSAKIAVYQNTVIMDSPSSVPAAAFVAGSQVRDVVAANNIFATRSYPIVYAEGSLRTASLLLRGNDYYTSGGTWSVLWGKRTFRSLSSWSTSTGQEITGGQPTGLTVNPKFTGPVSGPAVVAGAAGSPGNGFSLQAGSPLRGAGLDLQKLLGLGAGMRDYAGAPVPPRHPDIGAQ